MTEVTRILDAIGQGDPHAAEQLLPLVYDELRQLAAKRLAREKPGQTLQATALVHEAYLRLVGEEEPRHWDSRGHFFAAAAEAMRRILIDQARRRGAERHGARLGRIDLPDLAGPSKDPPLDLLALAAPCARLERLTRKRPGGVNPRFSPGRPWRRRPRPSASPARRRSGTGPGPAPGCTARCTPIKAARHFFANPGEHVRGRIT